MLPFTVYGTEGDVTLTQEDFSCVDWETELFGIGMENSKEAKLERWLPPRGEHPIKLYFIFGVKMKAGQTILTITEHIEARILCSMPESKLL
jgi:hypothetical protein